MILVLQKARNTAASEHLTRGPRYIYLHRQVRKPSHGLLICTSRNSRDFKNPPSSIDFSSFQLACYAHSPNLLPRLRINLPDRTSSVSHWCTVRAIHPRGIYTIIIIENGHRGLVFELSAIKQSTNLPTWINMCDGFLKNGVRMDGWMDGWRRGKSARRSLFFWD